MQRAAGRAAPAIRNIRQAGAVKLRNKLVRRARRKFRAELTMHFATRPLRRNVAGFQLQSMQASHHPHVCQLQFFDGQAIQGHLALRIHPAHQFTCRGA